MGRNYRSFFGVPVRVSTKGIANWGYPVVIIGGLSLWARASNGELIVASYTDPKGNGCWAWAVSLRKAWSGEPLVSFAKYRTGQWRDYLLIWPGYRLSIAQQDY